MVKIEWSRFKKGYLVNYPKKFRGSEFINIFIYTHTAIPSATYKKNIRANCNLSIYGLAKI